MRHLEKNANSEFCHLFTTFAVEAQAIGRVRGPFYRPDSLCRGGDNQ